MRKTLLIVMCMTALALAYSYDGIHWYNPPPPVHYMINQNGTPDCTNEFVMLDNGHQDWTDVVNSFFVYTYDGTTALMPAYVYTGGSGPQTDGHNVSGWFESWDSGYPGVIAVNVVWYYPGPNNIIETDQNFNGYNFTWSDSGQAGKMDVWDIGAHESGHGLMLGDLYFPSDMEKTMYGYSSTGETKKRSLEPDDISGCQFVYPDPSILGVKVTSFTANRVANGNQVLWQAEESGDHVGYNLYRCEGAGTVSGDVHKNGFVRVNSSMITGSSTYTYLDHYAGGKAVQYVLADVDSAGRETFHGPTPCEGASRTYALSLKVSPNPARTVANLTYTLPGTLESGNTASLRIYDLSGRLIVNHAITNQVGEGSYSWETASVPAGVYLVNLSSGGSRVNSRVVVAR